MSRGESESRSVALANHFPAECCQRNCPQGAGDFRGNILPHAEWFARMALELWRHKVAAHLDHLFQQSGVRFSERTCRAWGAGDNEPPARALALLLRSDDGPLVLAWIMRDDPPQWWRKLQLAHLALQIFR